MLRTSKISRLAYINCADSLLGVGDELRDERQGIVDSLKDDSIIELDENGGFHFIGDGSESNKEHYLDCYKNF